MFLSRILLLSYYILLMWTNRHVQWCLLVSWLVGRANKSFLTQFIPRVFSVLRSPRGLRKRSAEWMMTLSLLLRACYISTYLSLVHPWAGALRLLYAGDRLLLSQWGRRTTPSHEGGDRWHYGGHHRPERLWISAFHIRQSAAAQVGRLLE